MPEDMPPDPSHAAPAKFSVYSPCMRRLPCSPASDGDFLCLVSAWFEVTGSEHPAACS